ncbi:MAG: MFS transporter [Chloroflexi bacterium]|nr:MFS transporter [Chloroflexota bacterium]
MKSTPEGNVSELARRLPFFYGWVVVAVAVLGMFTSAPGQGSIMSMFLAPISEELHWSRTLLSGAVTVATVISGLTMPLWGHLLDRVGPRLLVVGVTLIVGAACIWMSRISTPLGLYVGFVLLRVFALGVMSLCCTTTVARWFIRKRGRASALTAVGMAAGLGVFPPLLQGIIDATDWRTAYLVMGFLVWGLMLVPALLFFRRQPEDMGLVPDGASQTGSKAGPDRPGPAAPLEPEWSTTQATRSRTFWLLVVATAASSVLVVAINFHQLPLLVERGLSPQAAARVLSVYALCFAGGAMLSGMVVERVPVRFAMMGQLLLLTGSVVILVTTVNILMALAFGLAFGLALGAGSALEPVLWANYYGRGHLGRIRGITMTFRVGASAVGPLVAGIAYDTLGGYTEVMAIMAFIPLLCIVALMLAGPPRQARLGVRAATS